MFKDKDHQKEKKEKKRVMEGIGREGKGKGKEGEGKEREGKGGKGRRREGKRKEKGRERKGGEKIEREGKQTQTSWESLVHQVMPVGVFFSGIFEATLLVEAS